MNITATPGAERDLEALFRADQAAWRIVVAFLEELDGSAEAITGLSRDTEVRLGRFRLNVKHWQAARKNNDNLSRIRILDSPATGYRIFFGHDWRTDCVAILAVLSKHDGDLIYETSSIPGRRITNEWREITGGRDT